MLEQSTDDTANDWSVDHEIEEAVKSIETDDRERVERHAGAVLLEDPDNPNAQLCLAVRGFSPYSSAQDTLAIVEKAISAGASEPVRRRLGATCLPLLSALESSYRSDGTLMSVPRLNEVLREMRLAYLIWPSETILPVLKRACRYQLIKMAGASSKWYLEEQTSELLAFSVQIRHEHPDWDLELPTAAKNQVERTFTAEREATRLAEAQERKEREAAEADRRWRRRYRLIASALVLGGALVQAAVPDWRAGFLWLLYNLIVLAPCLGFTGELAFVAVLISLSSWGVYAAADALFR